MPWPPAYNSSMAESDVCIRGSGVVGLAAALALARLGLSVALSAPPRRDPARPDVRAYALNAASVRLLSDLKVWDALPADARTAVYDMRVEGDRDGSALDFSAWAQGVDQLAWIVDTAALEEALATALRFAPHVREVDPTYAGAALEVLAEGRASAARQRLGVAMPAQPYAQRALAARLISDRPHGGLARQWFRAPDVLALLPFDRPHAGHSYALVWSLPERRAAEAKAMPAADFEAALGEATRGGAGALTLASERADWPLVLARAESVCGPGWVLLGDAAHLVHPLAGQGLNLGLADVAALAAEIAAREPWRTLGDEKLLRRYARRREAATWAMARVTDGLWQLFASQGTLPAELRNRGMTLVNRLSPLKRMLAARAIDG